MRRRQFLATASASVLGGCASGTGTPTSSETATVVRGSEASVVFRASHRYVYGADSMTVERPDRAQFAFVEPPESETDPPPDAFELVVGDRRFAPESPPPGYESDSVGGQFAIPSVGEAYTAGDRWGWLLFDLPTVDAETATLRQGNVRHPLPDGRVRRFGVAPDFTLDGVDVPETVRSDANLEIDVTVTNRGDRDGVFLAVVQEPGLPSRVDIPVPAGETRQETVRLDVHADPGGAKQFKFVHPGGEPWYEVDVEEPA